MPRIPFILVTGFIGSGKTTFLKRLLDRYSSEGKIGIIQNEFAPGSVDGTDLRQSGMPFEILEVNNGSVFCVCLLGSFIPSLGRFVEEHRPDALILEASGFSDPISIGEMLQAPELSDRLYLSHIWCLVDASSYEKLARNLPRVRHQVRLADTVIINKIDLGKDKLEDIRHWIRDLNPYAAVETASYCDISLKENLFAGAADPVAFRVLETSATPGGSGRPDIGTYVIKTTSPISSGGLKKFLDEVSPGSLRIKGFVKLDTGGMMAVQSCYGDTKMEPLAGYQGPTELIGIGPGINSRTFADRFRYFRKLSGF